MKIVVRVPNWIGDSIMCLPSLNSIMKNFPDSQIWIAARNWVKEIFYNLDFSNGVITLLKENSFNHFYRNINELKKEKFDLGILFTNSFASALLFYLARISQRWGYAKEGRSIFLSKAVAPKNNLMKHQIYYYLDLLKDLGLKVEKPEIHLKISTEENVWAEKVLKQLNIKEKSFIIGINPGAYYGPSKRWSAEKFADLVYKYRSELNSNVFLFGSKNEISLSEEILSYSKIPLFNFTGKTNLRQLMALISKCDLFITNDSGPMHIANALRIPVIAIFGPTEPSHTGPFFPPNIVIYKRVPCAPCNYRICPSDHKCMRDIQVDEVFEKSLELLR